MTLSARVLIRRFALATGSGLALCASCAGVLAGDSLDILAWSTARDVKPFMSPSTPIHVRPPGTSTLDRALVAQVEDILREKGYKTTATAGAARFELLFKYGTYGLVMEGRPPFTHRFDVVVLDVGRVPKKMERFFTPHNLSVLPTSQGMQRWEKKCVLWKGQAHVRDHQENMGVSRDDDARVLLRMLVETGMAYFGETRSRWSISAGAPDRAGPG